MIGIYNDSFIEMLKEHLGKENVKINTREIICPCPFCEAGIDRRHYHMYISLEAPVFHCFYAGCHQSGTITKLIRKITGETLPDKYIDDIEVLNKREIKKLEIPEKELLTVPPIDFEKFKLKSMYMRERIKDFKVNIKNMVFDLDLFFQKNYLTELQKEKMGNLIEYYQRNFIGFLTEHQSMLVLRNIDKRANIRYSKIHLFETAFPDYYKIDGPLYDSNTIVLAEGTFDILSEYVLRRVDATHNCKFIAAGLSSHYESLIKSLVFYEQIFKFDVHVLSDRDVPVAYYKSLKNNISYLLNKIVIYYNTTGKDFADHVGGIEKFVIE